MFRALADLADRRPRRTVIAAVVLAVLAAALGGSVADRLGPYDADDPASESYRAGQLLERSGANPTVDVVALTDRAQAERIAAELRRDPDIGRVTSPRQGGPGFVSRDRTRAYVTASFRPGVDEPDVSERLIDRFEGRDGVLLGGVEITQRQANEQVSKDLARAEMLAFPILFVLSLLFFRSAVAALLPLLVGGLSIVFTFLALRVASDLGTVSVFALNLVTGLGLGLAIDYSLFMVSRYREEIARHGPGREALRRTLATAGRTVLFSSLTVAAAVASLMVFPQNFLYSMGLGGSIVALIACGVALIVLPAVLALLGERVNSLAPARLQRAAEREARSEGTGFWYRLSRFVQRRPLRVAIASAATLVALGIPFLSIDFTAIDAQVLPADASGHRVDDALRTDFPPNRTTSTYLAVESAPGPEVEAYRRELRALPGVAEVSPVQPVEAGTTRIDVISRTAPLADQSQALVEDIRALDPPFTVSAGGQSASFIDLEDSVLAHLPIALAIIAAATLIVLFLFTGSLILPLKAVLMNLLTLSATFGFLVFVFQDGRLEGLLGYTSQGALEITQPIFLLAVAFGLSTDYGVFLLSRIKEARERGASDRDAVAIGLERTGRIVTAAALLFCVAIGAFATSEMVFIKELGLGTACAVVVDATIVRALLVPSLMELLGRWNWWAPKPLRRLHARIGLAEA
jgi:RND superfamily putative drug exporter